MAELAGAGKGNGEAISVWGILSDSRRVRLPAIAPTTLTPGGLPARRFSCAVLLRGRVTYDQSMATAKEL